MPITQQQKNLAQTQQFSAAHQTLQQVRLVAGPGTGKSFVIEERVLWLLRGGASPGTIFVVSFTRAAANELRSRIESYCAVNGIMTAMQVTVSTLHSLALRILRRAGLLHAYPADPSVLDRWELENIYDKEFASATGIPVKRCREIRIEHEAFWNTGNWFPPNYIPPKPSITQYERDQFVKFHKIRSQTYSCVLPGELIRKSVEFSSSGALDPVQLLDITNLIIDEFQDLNPTDLEFVYDLIDRGVITFVAGDDDQSIYSFRFASPAGLQQFVSKYPNAADHSLEHGFRCTPAILSTALNLLQMNPLPGRVAKNLHSLYSNSIPPIQGRVYRWNFASGAAEAHAIAESCKRLIDAGIPPREILILLSDTNMLERDLRAAFKSSAVPLQQARPNEYVNTDAGRLALAILRLICNKQDFLAFRTLLGLQSGVGVKTCDTVASMVFVNNLNYIDIFTKPLPSNVFAKKELNAISSVAAKFLLIDKMDPDGTLLNQSSQISEILNDFLGVAAKQQWVQSTLTLPNEMSLRELRDYLMADTDEQQSSVLLSVYTRLGKSMTLGDIMPPYVRLMTMHGAKGLSARIVFIPGLEEQIFPGQWRRPFPGLVHEAARLLYVSISRARVACITSFASSRIVHGNYKKHSPSRFIPQLSGSFSFRQTPLDANEVAGIVVDCNNL